LKKSIAILFSVIGLFISCSYEGHKSEGPVTVEGYVLWDGSNKPIPNVTVFVGDSESYGGFSLFGESTTDSNGRYQVNYEKYEPRVLIELHHSLYEDIVRFESLGDSATDIYYNPPSHIWLDIFLRAKGFLDLIISNEDGIEYHHATIKGSLEEITFDETSRTDPHVIEAIAEKPDSIVLEVYSYNTEILYRKVHKFFLDQGELKQELISL